MRVGLGKAAGAAAAFAVLFLMPSGVQAKARATLPAAVIGLWGFEPADCDRADSDGRLTVEDRAILFFASGYDIVRVVRRPDGAWRASGFRAEEGEAVRTRGGVTLKLIAPDRLHVVTDSAEGHIYHRCRPGHR